MAWKPSIDTNPQWFAEALLGQAAEFRSLEPNSPANPLRKLRNAVEILAIQGFGRYEFAPLRWTMATLAGADWFESNASRWIKPLKRFETLLVASGLRRTMRGDDEFDTLRAQFVGHCYALGQGPSAGGIDAEADNRVFLRFQTEPDYQSSEEIEPDKRFPEGALSQKTVNRYERRKDAREACIAIHGLNCQVCGMDFRETYGDLGLGFIHVHHRIPLANLPDEYTVNPETDLVPICPNCHSMIHRMEDPSDVEGLRRIWKERNARDGN